MTDLIDQSIRQQAIEPSRSFIIRAPAGSGKTELLIQRFLALLATVDSPEEIIAMTFTRKAADEIRNRILAEISQAHQADKQIKLSPHKQLSRQLAAKVLARDQEKKWQLLYNPNRLCIQTIDSFCAYLVHEIPILSNLGAMPTITEEPDYLYEMAVEQTLTEFISNQIDVVEVLLHFDNDLIRLKRLMISMLGKREQWLGATEQERRLMEQALYEINTEQLKHLNIPSSMLNELCELLKVAQMNLAEHDQAHCGDITDLEHDLMVWQAIANLLLTKENTWRKSITKKQGFPTNYKQEKNQLINLIDKLSHIEGLSTQLALIKNLCTPIYADQEWQLNIIFSKLLRQAAARLLILFAEHNQVDFAQVLIAACTALGTDEQPTDIALNLDCQIRHLLVDECQDISRNQFILFSRLVREWSEGDGNSLFLVGDPMQSIYGFRQAELGLFIDIFDNQKFAHLNIEALSLSVNFRAHANLINWLNNSFIHIFPEQNNPIHITEAVSYHLAEVPPTHHLADEPVGNMARVEVYPYHQLDDEAEAQQVVKIIQAIQAQDATEEIAILVRSRAHLVTINQALNKHHIKFQAMQVDKLEHKPIIRDLLSLMRAYLYPADRLAALSCLRAPWCGISLASLLAIAAAAKQQTIWSALGEQTMLAKLSADDQKRVLKLQRVFDAMQKNRYRQPLLFAIQSLWYQCHAAATIKPEDIMDVETFFSLLARLEKSGGIEDMDRFTNELSKLYAPASGDHTVKLMVIHQAKGLEFDHVICPSLGKTPRPNSNEMIVYFNYQDHFIMAPIHQKGKNATGLYQTISYINKQRQDNEIKRLLYVATTRAKQSLHLLGHINPSKNNLPHKASLLYCLRAVVANEFDREPPQDVSTTEPTEHINQDNYRLAEHWQAPSLPDDIKPLHIYHQAIVDTKLEFSWAGHTIQHIGTLVHNILQRIGDDGVLAWNKERVEGLYHYCQHSLSQAGVMSNELDNAVTEAINAVLNMLADPKGQWILSSHRFQHSEYAISGIYQQQLCNVILDRIFIDEHDHCWIVDYKLSRHQGTDLAQFLAIQADRYQHQLKKYASLVSGLGHQNIRTGLYFPLLKSWYEINDNEVIAT